LSDDYRLENLVIERSPPVAQQVYEHLRQQLLEGGYTHGQRMPSETQLAQDFSVSRATVRQALAMLEAQRLVSRRQGDGTFATPDTVDLHLKPHNEWQIIHQIQASGREATMELLTVEHRPAAPQEVDELRLTKDQPVHHLRYRFLADGLPVMIGVYTLPEAVLKPFNAEHDLKQPLMNFVAQFSHHQLEYGHVQFDAVAASPVLAADLSVEPGTPLLDMHGAVYAPGNMPLFLMHEYYRQGEGLRFRFTHP
jgi:DNA-binding GntR family transcriptional regulator